MRYVLLLALLLPSLAFGDGGYLMDQKSKDGSLTILNELESNLQTLKDSLQKATENSVRLGDDLKLLSLKLENSEKLLREAKLNLEASEASLIAVQLLLNQASQALKDSEQSFKDYQRSEILRLLGVGGVMLVAGVLVGMAF